MKRIAGLSLLALLLAGTVVAGCGARREVEQLAIVTAVAIDRLPNGDLEWTVEVPRPTQVGAGVARTGGAGEKSVLREGRGRTIQGAARRLNESLSRELFWADANYLLIGEDMARHGLGPLTDFLSRNYQVRRTTLIFVTQGRAGEVLRRLSPRVEATRSQTLRDLVRTVRPMTIPEIDVNNFLRVVSEDGADPYVPVLEANVTGDGVTPVSVRVAAFHGDHLAGMLSPEETTGLLWMLHRNDFILLDLPCPEDPGAYASVEIERVVSSLRMQGRGEEWRGEIRVRGEGDIRAWACRERIDSEAIHYLSRQAESVALREMRQSLAAMQRLETDLVGFGAELHRVDPSAWRQLASRWPQHFASLPVDVAARLDIRRVGLTLGGPPGAGSQRPGP